MSEDEHIDYFDLGYNFFKTDPDMPMTVVWWHAGKLSERKEDQYNFVSGYSTARRQRDDYEREGR
jgi:hypothetical protein